MGYPKLVGDKVGMYYPNNIIHLVEGFSFNDQDKAYVSFIPELKDKPDGYYFEYSLNKFEGPYRTYAECAKAITVC